MGESLKIESMQKVGGENEFTPAGDKYVTNHIYANVAEGESGKFMSEINDSADQFNSGPMSYQSGE